MLDRFINNNIFNLTRFTTESHQPPRFSYILLKSYIDIFPFKDYDPLYQTYLGRSLKIGNAYTSRLFIENLKNPLVLISCFLGINNQITHFNGNKKYSSPLSQFVKKTFGWHDEDSPDYQKILNYTLLLPLLYFIFNLILIISTSLLNIVRMFTEWLPKLAENICFIAARRLRHGIYNHSHGIIKLTVGLGIAVLLFGHMIFKIVGWAARILTSPLESIRAARKVRHDIDGIAGTIISTGLTILSALISITAYVTALPISLSILAIKFPVLAKTMLVPIQSFATKSTTVTAIAHGLGNLVLPAVKAVSTKALSSTLIGASTLLAGAGTLVITSVNLLLVKFRGWWCNQKQTYPELPRVTATKESPPRCEEPMHYHYNSLNFILHAWRRIRQDNYPRIRYHGKNPTELEDEVDIDNPVIMPTQRYH